ncbi:MAG: hypothetical protein ACP5LX_06940 [Nitrososphaeria archaeon]
MGPLLYFRYCFTTGVSSEKYRTIALPFLMNQPLAHESFSTNAFTPVFFFVIPELMKYDIMLNAMEESRITCLIPLYLLVLRFYGAMTCLLL